MEGGSDVTLETREKLLMCLEPDFSSMCIIHQVKGCINQNWVKYILFFHDILRMTQTIQIIFHNSLIRLSHLV